MTRPSTTPVPSEPRRGMTLEQRRNRDFTLLTIPGLALYAVGMLLPIVIGFMFSLTDWSGTKPTWNFIGFSNYAQILKEERFYSSLGFTLTFAALNTIIQNLLALGLALFLNMKLRGVTFYKTLVFAPSLISAIIVGFLWSQLFGSIMPDILKTFGVANPSINLLSQPSHVMAGLLVINNWQWAGYWMLIYLAALRAVPIELYEAAIIDGAGTFRRFFSITLPMIAPAITVNVIAIMLGSFQVYELIVTATRTDGTSIAFKAVCRIDTPQEVNYYKNGGILQYVLRQLLGK